MTFRLWRCLDMPKSCWDILKHQILFQIWLYVILCKLYFILLLHTTVVITFARVFILHCLISVESVNSPASGCIGKYTPRGPRDFSNFPAADPLWLAHHPRLPLPQRWQAHQAGLSHHTGQLLSRNITKPDAVRIEDPAAAPSAKRDTQVKF